MSERSLGEPTCLQSLLSEEPGPLLLSSAGEHSAGGVESGPYSLSVLREHHGITFAPLVCEKVALMAELEIQMLWAQNAGSIVTRGGDIDNRLKTLFDSLRVPSGIGEVPEGETGRAGENPFFCLLEDDKLLSRVAIETDRLLEADVGSTEVALFIRVRTRQMKTMIGTIGLS